MAEKGPRIDRTLMRIKDAIIIGTALLALIKWLYINPLQYQDRAERQERILNLMLDRLEKIERLTQRDRGN